MSDTPDPGRTPDVEAAERAVLGTIITSRTAAEAVTAILDQDDCFASGIHQAVYAAVRHLTEAGEPCDVPSVLKRLVVAEQGVWRSGQAGVILASLMESATPSYAVHAQTVLRAARQRRTLAALTSAFQVASGPGFDADDGGDMILKLIGDATAGPAKTELRSQAEILSDVVDGLERGIEPGLRTGYSDLDDVLGGLRPGTLIVVGARPGMGKALALDTPIPTPQGWTTMKDIQVGDYVFGMDGKPTRVTFATEVMYRHACYDVEFSDGAVITADAEHQWLTETRASRRAATPPGGYVFNRTSPFSHDQRWKSEQPGVKTTEGIRQTLRTGPDGRLNHSIPLAAPLVLPDAKLPIDPYVLGYWLGDGGKHDAVITVGDADLPNLIGHIEATSYHHGESRDGPATWKVRVSTQPIRKGGAPRDTLRTRLREQNLLCNKHIPDTYMRASEPQRQALLAGLLDSDGTISQSHISLELTSKRLAEQALELVATLGYQPKMRQRPVKGRSPESSVCYRVGFSTANQVFRLPRKQARIPATARSVTSRRYVVDVRPVESVPVRCIAVDNADHMYLAGRTCIPTHNTIIGGGFAEHVSTRLGLPVLFASMEMTAEELMLRRMASTATVPLDSLVRHNLSDDHWDRLNRAHDNLAGSALIVDDQDHVSLAHIRARLRGMERAGNRARMLVIDYLGLFREPKAENRQNAVAALARGCKHLAREFAIPVVLLAQVKRAAEGRADKIPGLSDLRESGEIEQAADVVLLLHREDYYERESPRAGELDVIVAKNRQGPLSTVTLLFQGHYGRIVGLAPEDCDTGREWTPTSMVGGAA